MFKNRTRRRDGRGDAFPRTNKILLRCWVIIIMTTLAENNLNILAYNLIMHFVHPADVCMIIS